MSRKWNRKKPPSGWDYIEPTMDALDREMREAVDAPHEGLRKAESQWPIHQINWQRSRYVYDMFYKYKRISRALYDYCIRNKLIDAALIAKWKKPGYERLCSVHAINTSNQNFGTTSICRVPRQQLRPGQVVEARITGCRGCCSGPGGYSNIFGNKYGQYLAAIQIAREEAATNRGEAYKQDKKHIFAEDHDEIQEAVETSRTVAQEVREDEKQAAIASQDWLGEGAKKKKRKANDVDTQGEEGGAAKSGRSGDDDNASANAESAEGDDNHE